MFNKNKIESYINATKKIEIPTVKGEEYIMIKENKKSKKVFNKLGLIASCACLFLIGSFFIGTGGKSDGTTANLFTIVAASATEGDDGVAIEKGAIKELPGGKISLETGDSTIVGFTIKGSNIKSIDLSTNTGYFQEGYIKNDIDDEIFKESEKKGVISIEDEVGTIELDSVEERESSDKKNSIIEVVKKMRVIGTDESLEYGIFWSPKEAIDGVEAGVTNPLELKGDEILVKVTFKDGTTSESTIETSYNKDGNILAKLK